ncbi:MAG: AAA family ATPase [Proteobacteria bacterium]|nr:AAA family ATPase [Pseudomonadota bacterium]
MLIEISVTNFKSIQTKQTLSLMASTASELRNQNTFPIFEQDTPRLLRSAAIYGPNASGKTNFIEAIEFIKDFVVESSKEGQEGKPVDVKPFLFDYHNRNKPSEFEILFMQDGIRYQYGFAVNRTHVTHEWLIAYPEGRPQRWFEREFNIDEKSYSWYFGSKFKGHKIVLQEATRTNALFLSTSVQLNNDQLKPIYNWFYQELHVITSVAGLPPTYSTAMCRTDEGRRRILKFLNAADLSIADIKVEMKKFDSTALPSDMPEPIKDLIRKDLDGTEIPDLKFLHSVKNTAELVPLDDDDESVGTRKLFAISGPWLDILDNGHVLIVDEMNNSMHPLMVRFLIGLINNPESNKHNAQVIFSTHDTSVLDNDLFRRDQIWFTEKDSANSTKLYPLSDFTPRKGEALEKGYLKGRYGALPYIGEMRF